MDAIRHGIENAYLYMSKAFFEQNHDATPQEESSWPSFQTMAISFFIVTVGAYAIKRLIHPPYQAHRDTPVSFWKELEESQRPPLPLGPVVLMGKVIANDLSSIQKQMFSSCKESSKLFVEYIQRKGLKPKSVIDLGCGLGVNSIPLLKYGVHVIAIDSMKCLLDSYKLLLKNEETKFVSLKCADITSLEKYSREDNVVDVVLAIDVLPYLPISCWKSTMTKIVASLKPGGYFFGTLFVKEKGFDHPVIAVHERLGAQYYSIRHLAIRLILHSGLSLIQCRVRKDSVGCYEFVARKPIIDDKSLCFSSLLEGKPLMIS